MHLLSKKPFKAAVLYAAFFCCALNAQTGGSDINIPYGNLGLDFTAGKINDANKLLEEKSGVNFFFDCYAVLLSNPSGGESQGTNFTQEMIFGLSFDLQKIAYWKGASFKISGAYSSGDDLSQKIGNFFTPSESLVRSGAIFYELYFQQNLESDWGTFKIRLGRMAMSGSFMDLPVFGNLVSGGMDSTPEAVFFNSPFTSSPIATWGAAVEYSPLDEIYLSAGIYQIPKNIQSPKWDGTNFSIHSSDGYMVFTQAQWSPEFFSKTKDGKKAKGTGLEGVYQMGAYFFDGYDMPRFAGGTRDNAYGFYLQMQQMVWRSQDTPSQYVSLWAGAQYAPVKSIAIMPWMAYAGLQMQGFIPARSRDGIFISWMCGWFGGEYKSSAAYNATYETVIEATYVWQLNDNIAIQPDIQYIMRPYGNRNIDDALVIGGQVVVSF